MIEKLAQKSDIIANIYNYTFDFSKTSEFVRSAILGVIERFRAVDERFTSIAFHTMNLNKNFNYLFCLL